MLQVMCVKKDEWANKGGPTYGEVCEVIEVYDGDSYILEGYEYNKHDGVPEAFRMKYFIPLSDIDETEMGRNYQKETV